MTALTLTNVSKFFGSVEVLKDINLTVEDGEFVVFVDLRVAVSPRYCA